MRIRRSNWRMATLQRAALVLALAPLVFAALALAALALAPLALAPLALAALALAPRQRFHLSPRLSVVLYACDGAVIRRQRPRAAWPWPARAHFSFAVASTARFSSNLSATNRTASSIAHLKAQRTDQLFWCMISLCLPSGRDLNHRTWLA